MKKTVNCMVIVAVLTMTCGMLVTQAESGSCGSGCDIKKDVYKCASEGSCVCDEKTWYKPQTWFKKCPVCDAKEEIKS